MLISANKFPPSKPSKVNNIFWVDPVGPENVKFLYMQIDAIIPLIQLYRYPIQVKITLEFIVEWWEKEVLQSIVIRLVVANETSCQ